MKDLDRGDYYMLDKDSKEKTVVSPRAVLLNRNGSLASFNIVVLDGMDYLEGRLKSES